MQHVHETRSEPPLISIGLTCFNAVDTIERAIRSALQQNWPSTEILVVDDGSQDGSVDVLHRLEVEVSNLRAI